MITLDVNQEIAPVDERLDEALIVSIEGAINNLLKDLPEGEIAISYVSDGEIKRLNRIYRGKDEVTDVLSFSYLDEAKRRGPIGDVAISFTQAKRQAMEGDLRLELVDLVVHGVLHVLGYDHERPEDAEVMFPLQDKVVSRVI
ncbi:rRNA maturation RNase YbeY [Patescibacteria group bacterium]|nr:rRNA maturation RNase YbeY [Patescibacteria group bacterium]